MASRISKKWMARGAISLTLVGLGTAGVLHVVASTGAPSTLSPAAQAKIDFLQREIAARQSALAAPRATKPANPTAPTPDGSKPQRQAGIMALRHAGRSPSPLCKAARSSCRPRAGRATRSTS